LAVWKNKYKEEVKLGRSCRGMRNWFGKCRGIKGISWGLNCKLVNIKKNWHCLHSSIRD